MLPIATSKFQLISSNNLVTEKPKAPFTSHPKARQLLKHTIGFRFGEGVTEKDRPKVTSRTNVIHKDLLETISLNGFGSSCLIFNLCWVKIWRCLDTTTQKKILKRTKYRIIIWK